LEKHAILGKKFSEEGPCCAPMRKRVEREKGEHPEKREVPSLTKNQVAIDGGKTISTTRKEAQRKRHGGKKKRTRAKNKMGKREGRALRRDGGRACSEKAN